MTNRVERRMVKCYFSNDEPNARCIGYISDNFTEPQGYVSYFEEWFLLPLRFSPRRKLRNRIIDESARAMTISMEKTADPAISRVAARFFPRRWCTA